MTIAPTADGCAPLAQAVERCCAAEGSAPITREDAELVARLLKAVADPVRLQILGIVRCSPAQQTCACDLPEPLGISQPTVSHHLRILTECGVTRSEKRGRNVWYSVVPEALAALRTALAPG